jgi:hypothetical protein
MPPAFEIQCCTRPHNPPAVPYLPQEEGIERRAPYRPEEFDIARRTTDGFWRRLNNNQDVRLVFVALQLRSMLSNLPARGFDLRPQSAVS